MRLVPYLETTIGFQLIIRQWVKTYYILSKSEKDLNVRLTAETERRSLAGRNDSKWMVTSAGIFLVIVSTINVRNYANGLFTEEFASGFRILAIWYFLGRNASGFWGSKVEKGNMVV
jgi:hypothetical protein